MPNPNPSSRFLIKIPGEAIGQRQDSLLKEDLFRCAQSILDFSKESHECACVLGAGNLWRGALAEQIGIDRATSDYMGMLGTLMNSMALSGALKTLGAESRVMSAIRANQVCEPYIRGKALSHFARGRIVILSAGSGNPFFTTDCAASLRSAELGCGMILRVSSESLIHKAGGLGKSLSFDQALELNLLDAGALVLAREHGIPIALCFLASGFSLHQASSDASARILISG